MSQLPVYLSAPVPCTYRPQELSRSAFVDPRMALSDAQREALGQLGFRRSGPTYYRPACPSCQACQSTRVDIQAFEASRRQRRCWSRNEDLLASWATPVASEERFSLYRRYLASRHAGGDMDPDDREGFERFLCDNPRGHTRHLLIRDSQGRLLACCVADRLDSGLSAVYTFFDPDEASRALGRYAVLRLIQTCRSANLPWLYLGYYIADCGKMSYKSEYKPQQRLIRGQWQWAGD